MWYILTYENDNVVHDQSGNTYDGAALYGPFDDFKAGAMAGINWQRKRGDNPCWVLLNLKSTNIPVRPPEEVV